MMEPGPHELYSVSFKSFLANRFTIGGQIS